MADGIVIMMLVPGIEYYNIHQTFLSIITHYIKEKVDYKRSGNEAWDFLKTHFYC